MARSALKPAPQPTFQELLKSHTLQSPPNLDDEIAKTLDGMGRLATRGFMHQNDANYWTSMSMLVEHYFSLQIAKRGYAPINNELFNITRYATVDVTYEKDNRGAMMTHAHSLELPLFLAASMGAENWEWTRQVSHQFDEYNREHVAQVKITAPVPAPTSAVQQKALEASAAVHEIIAQSRREKVLSDLLMFSKQKLPQPTEDLCTIWIPRDEDVSVSYSVTRKPERDPALTLWYQKRHFVITTWNVPEEKPFERILQEYAGMQNLQPFKDELKLS
jgi:hypothetical protein